MDTPWKFVIVEKLKPCTCAKGRLLYPLRSRGALAYCCCPPSANRPSGVMASAQRVSSSLQEAIADPQFFSHGDAKAPLEAAITLAFIQVSDNYVLHLESPASMHPATRLCAPYQRLTAKNQATLLARLPTALHDTNLQGCLWSLS